MKVLSISIFDDHIINIVCLVLRTVVIKFQMTNHKKQTNSKSQIRNSKRGNVLIIGICDLFVFW